MIATSACPDRRDALADLALGQEPSPDVVDHLDRCAPCREELAALREKATHADETLRRLVSQDPSELLRPRVLAQVARPSSRPRVLAGTAAVAACVFVVVLLAHHREERRLIQAARSVAAWRSPTASLIPEPSRLPGEVKLGESLFTLSKELRHD